MSFGFGVGDFLAVIDIVQKIRKDFLGAPIEFKAISDEVRSLSIVLQDVEVYSECQLHNGQMVELNEIANGCRNILNELELTLDKYKELDSGNGNVGQTVKRAWKRLKWEPEDIKQLRSRISTNVGLFNAFTIQLTTKNVVTLVQHQEDQDRQAILNWITPIDYAPQQSDFVSRQQAGTGQWLLDSTKFKEWLQMSKQTLFCPGIPGAGKTILTSIVVEELTTLFENDDSASIAYLYCNFQRHHEQKLEDLLASLLKQFVQEQPFMPDLVKELHDRHKDKRTRPSLNEVLEVLYSVITTCSKAFIIIDALDECQATNNCRAKFLSELFNLQAECGVNLFMTSRFNAEITEKFDRTVSLEIRASDEDMLRYIDGQMPSLLQSRISQHLDLQSAIRQKIPNVVDGMFLLAKLHMDSLKNKITVGDIRVALDNLPKGNQKLDATYEQAMDRIEGQEEDAQKYAKEALCWIVHAKRPLRGSELQCALGVRTGTSELDTDFIPELEGIVSVCAGLVTVDKESDIIRLVHYTTQEYFQRTQTRWFPNADINITTTCVTYLSFDTFKDGHCETDTEFEERIRLNKLYDYAAHNWGHHAQAATALGNNVIEFLQKQAQVEASSQALMTVKRWSGHKNYSDDIPKQMTGLHLVGYFGIDDAVRDLIVSNSPDPKDSYNRTPLWLTAERGHEAVVKLLLETGNVDTNSKDKYCRTPLAMAAENGHEAVVKLLLETDKVDVDSKTNDGHTPLWMAAARGQEAVVKLLLETDKASVDFKDKRGQTLLSIAAERGQEAVVKLLLETGKVDADSKDKYGQTPLWRAADRGKEAVIKLLLETGKVDADVKDEYDQTPLLMAAGSGQEAAVKLLLETGKVDANSKNKHDQTPIWMAASRGREAVVKLLLETGKVDVESRDEDGQTPLLIAADRGHEAVVKLLLKSSEVDANSQNKYGQTPLLMAVESKQEAVVKLLLETSKVDPDSKDKYGRTPLLIAARRGEETVVKLLLETGKVDVGSNDSSEQTPLWWASMRGHEAVVKLLLEKGKVDSLT